MSSSSPAAGDFSATRWSVVLAAGSDSTRAQAALAQLCSGYWYPLYAFARRCGYSPHDAEDATQGFFAHLLAHHAIGSVDPTKGRFRSFLLASLKNFLANERVRQQAQKRGGGEVHLPLDGLAGEERYRGEPIDELSPDRLFDRRWALTVLERSLSRLGSEEAAAGRGDAFEALKPALGGLGTLPAYAKLGAQLGTNEGALKVAVHRLRQRYRTMLRAEIAETVADPAEIDGELRHLLEALGS